MFEDLRSAFREAYVNFNKELNREHVPETVNRLIGGMVDEIADVKAEVAHLETQIAKAVAGAENEKGQAATCRRREQMAREIGDSETADVAAQFAEKRHQPCSPNRRCHCGRPMSARRSSPGMGGSGAPVSRLADHVRRIGKSATSPARGLAYPVGAKRRGRRIFLCAVPAAGFRPRIGL